jgi:hypothetical protein
MGLVNRTPYKAKACWGRDKDGVHEWLVAVKGTFDIKPSGETAIAEEQVEPLLVPEYHGDLGTSSVRYDADLVAPKPTTDVLINGTAYAPGGRPSADFLVSGRVDRVHKVLRVLGNRTWRQGLLRPKPSEAEPVAAVPITYERAYGGYDPTDPDLKNHRLDPRNPVGRGVFGPARDREGEPLHNFEYPRGNPEKAGPAGFGALDAYWSPRRELQGTYDEAWQRSRAPLLPADWDPRSLLCSPADQQPEAHLRGGELVDLDNLTTDGKLRFTLPKIFLSFVTRVDGRSTSHRGRLATVIIEPDHPRVILVWLTSLTVRVDCDYVDETTVYEKAYLR